MDTNICREGEKTGAHGSSQWMQVTGQEAMAELKDRRFHLNIRKQFVHREGYQALDKITHGGCGVTFELF